MIKKTILNDTHQALGAKMVDFSGWEMPIHYGSQIDEHHHVRRNAGIFDVSHMTVIDLHGTQVRPLLRRLLANSVDKLKVPGKALYSCMLNPQGGVIDDLIVYYLREDYFRFIVNAATREKDLAWINTQASAFNVRVEERADLAMLAVQGPAARAGHQPIGRDSPRRSGKARTFRRTRSRIALEKTPLYFTYWIYR